MDDSVLAAIAKWPNVPAVFGWLSLTARGEWRLRNEAISNPAINAFIGRNYTSDEGGRWFFQNGPQRVFVDLEVAPWVWRVGESEALREVRAHNGTAARLLQGAWLDDQGRLFLRTDVGFGLVDSPDTSRVLDALHAGGRHEVTAEEFDAWLAGHGPRVRVCGERMGLRGDVELERLRADEAPHRFGYVCMPRMTSG
jgi:hypothetical protein